MIASHRNLAQMDTFKDQTQIYIEPVKRLAFAAPKPRVGEQKLNTSYTTKKALVCKIKSLERIIKMNEFKGFSKMVLRLVSGPMLEKKNTTGPLADRQKVLLTARLGGFPFSRISNNPANGKFS